MWYSDMNLLWFFLLGFWGFGGVFDWVVELME